MYKKYSEFSAGIFTGLVEVWKDVEGWEDCYQVSSFGNVRSKDKVRIKMRNGTLVHAPYKGRDRKLKISKSGYPVVSFKDGDRCVHPSVHRLVALNFIPNYENKPTVNHKDGNKQNNNVSNLEWNTEKEQAIHAVENNLFEKRGAPKFSKDFKREIYDFFENNEISIAQLAVKFNISERTAGRIVNNGVVPRSTTRILKSGEVIKENILTKEQVEEIKTLRSQGWTFKMLSEKFNRGLSQMHRVVNGLSRATTIE